MIKHLFILNPVAGVKNCVPELTEAIKKAFILNTDRKDETYEIVLTKKRRDATYICREKLQQAKEKNEFLRIYACGGDGTLNDVVNGCAGFSDFAICPVPVGSGNDFIKSLEDIPKEKFLDISACVRGSIVPCDVMKVGDKYSINIISIGLDAITGKRQAYFKKIPGVSGPFAYKIALGVTFITSMKNKVKFIVDGEDFCPEWDNVTLAVAGNGKWYGGGFKAAPFADVNDGLIDFVVAKSVSRMTFLKYVSTFKNGEHIGNLPFIKYCTCKKIQAISDEPFPIQFDGEIEFLKDPLIEIVPKGLNIIIPETKK